jgi:hypothetical protein
MSLNIKLLFKKIMNVITLFLLQFVSELVISFFAGCCFGFINGMYKGLHKVTYDIISFNGYPFMETYIGIIIGAFIYVRTKKLITLYSVKFSEILNLSLVVALLHFMVYINDHYETYFRNGFEEIRLIVIIVMIYIPDFCFSVLGLWLSMKIFLRYNKTIPVSILSN